jgi:hypothetical protein
MLFRSIFASLATTHQLIALVFLFWSMHQALHPSSPPPSILRPEKSYSLRGLFCGLVASFMNFFEGRCPWYKFASFVTNFFKGMCFCSTIATFSENAFRYICFFFRSLGPFGKSSKYNCCICKWTLPFNKFLELVDPFQQIPFLLQKLLKVIVFVVSHLTTSMDIGSPFVLSSFL